MNSPACLLQHGHELQEMRDTAQNETHFSCFFFSIEFQWNVELSVSAQ